MDNPKEDETEESQIGESKKEDDELVLEDDSKEIKEEEETEEAKADDSEQMEDEEIEAEGKIKKVGSDTQESIAFYPHQVKRKRSKTPYLIALLVLILAFLGIYFRQQVKSLVVTEPKPTPTPAVTPAPTLIPNPLIRSEWSFEVLNGTTTSGLAKNLSDKLKELGYSVVKIGNADKQNYSTTQILVKKDLISKIDLVVADLKDTVKISSMAGELTEGTASARIIIGKDLSL